MAKKKKNIKLNDAEKKFSLQTITNRFKIAENYQNPIFNKLAEYYEYYRVSYAQMDSNIWRSQIKVPYIKQVVDTILPRLVSNKPTINTLPREPEDTVNAQSMEKLVTYQWDTMRMNKKLKQWVKAGLIYGVSIMKIGWDWDEKGKDGLWAEPISIYDFYKDPKTSTIDGSWVIYKQERDLKTVKDNPNYDTEGIDAALSSNDSKWKIQEQASLGRSEPDDDERKKVIVYEYYGPIATEQDGEEKEMLIVTANNKHILRAVPLDEIYPCGVPFVAFQDDIMPNDFWAIGEVEPLVALQDELDTLRNQRIDNRKLITNHMWLVDKTKGINWEDFVSRPGGIIECDDVNAVKPLPVNDTTQNTVQEEAIIKQDMDRTSGVFPGMMGQIQKPMGATGDVNQTARGFLASLEQAGTKMQYKLDNLDDAIRELGRKMLKMNQKYISREQVIRIVGKSGIQFEKIPVEAIRKEYDLFVEGGSTQPQNKEVKKIMWMNLLQLLVPLSQMPLMDYEPGRPPAPTKLNVKWVLDNLLKNFDVPNIEEAFISQMGFSPPPGMPGGMPPGMPGMGGMPLNMPNVAQPQGQPEEQGIAPLQR